MTTLATLVIELFSIASCPACDWFIRQAQIPVNRFLYWEMSKYIFYGIVLLTLVDGEVSESESQPVGGNFL